MNDFITKPVRAPDMGAAPARAIDYLRQRPKLVTPAPATPAATPDQAPPGLSEAELLAALDAEDALTAQAPAADTMALPPEILGKITEIFLRETPRRLASMRQAFAAQDATTVGLEAHTLKSNARYLNATLLSKLCARIEFLADKKQLTEIDPLLREAEQSFFTLREQLRHPLSA
jgi:HPt (histidine-containing phosphotransfer) domain-containing protein